MGDRTFEIPFGILVIVTVLIVILLYIFILKAILIDSDIRKLTVYRFIVLLAVFDVMEASVHTVTGLAVIFPHIWSIDLGNFFGSILIPSYFCYVLTGFLLSFIRFMQIVYPQGAEILFYEQRGTYWLGIVLVVFLPYFGLMFSPLSMCYFNLNSYTWEYDLSLPLSYFVQYIEQYIQQFMIGLSCIFYFIIFGVLWRTGNVHGISSKRERRIMYQTFFVTVYATILNAVSHNMWWINKGRVPQVFALCTYFWMLNTAVYPLTFLIMNRTMRLKFIDGLKFLCFLRKSGQSTLKVQPSIRSEQ